MESVISKYKNVKYRKQLITTIKPLQFSFPERMEVAAVFFFETNNEAT